MSLQLLSSPSPVAKVVDGVLLSRTITRSERHQLVAALASGGILDEEDRIRVRRVLYGIRHGLLELVD